MSALLAWYARLGQAQPTVTPANPLSFGPPPPPEEDLRWARRETQAILRRARALDIDIDLARAPYLQRQGPEYPR